MFWLIEEKEQLEQFSARGFKEVFLEVIPHNFNTHPILDSISLLYVRPVNASKGYMLCVDHSEALSLNYDAIIQTLKGIEKIYVRDKKATLQYLPLKALFDIQPTFNTYIPEQPHVYSFFYQKHRKQKDINRLIPVVKHYEYCETIFRDLKPFNLDCSDDYCQWFNKKSSIVFSAIEANGIKINKDEFKKHFERDPEDEFVFTSYNLKTLTTRPSNKFGGINYAALNKENGCRKSFIPRNDVFVELDISAYHPTLSGKLVGYNFGDDDIHKAFASMYNVDYKKAKELTFKQLYGGVFKQYENLEFFQRVKIYTDDLWERFQSQGYIKMPQSGYILRKEDTQDMKPQKLFNYVLQNLETSTNVLILWEILKLLRGKKTKLVLYTYDAFLFDVDKEEKQLIKEIQKLIKGFKLNTKMSYGTSYDFK
jgi:hypothetical protein